MTAIDGTWAWIREPLLAGALGPCSCAKVATMRPNELARDHNFKLP